MGAKGREDSMLLVRGAFSIDRWGDFGGCEIGGMMVDDNDMDDNSTVHKNRV